jgi:hypothetical protein
VARALRLCGGFLLALWVLGSPAALAATPRAGIWEGTNARSEIVTFDVRPGEGPFKGQPVIVSLQSPGAIADDGWNGMPVRNGRVSDGGLSVRFGTATSASGRVGTPLLPFTARWVSPGRFTEIPVIVGPDGGSSSFATGPAAAVKATAHVRPESRRLSKLIFGPLLLGFQDARPDPMFIRGNGRLVGGPYGGVHISGRLAGRTLFLTVVVPKDFGPALPAGTYRVALTLTQTQGSTKARTQPTDAELLREICKRSPGYPPCKNR